jgi:dethiobiotin synthetase
MAARLIVVAGTGTGIGKTHLGEALLLAWGRLGRRVAALKPVESGVADPADTRSDGARLARAASFHVKHPRFVFPDPVSPHLAARRAGTALTLPMLTAPVFDARALADGVLLELPGGLFTPLAPGFLNADLARELRPDLLLLVAPDRLGVLHDLVATTTAAQAVSLAIHGVVLVAPATPDPSTGHNAGELPAFIAPPVLATLPRASPEELSRAPELGVILRAVAG